MACAVTEQWTIRSVVGWMTKDFEERGLDSPRLDADLLVAHALGLDRLRLFLDLDRPLHPEELRAVRGLVARRRAYEPVAYILGHREFYGRRFSVDRRVLVPRPDTETLVERALDALAERTPERVGEGGTDSLVRVLDLCTGSGAVGATLAAERDHVYVDVTDISPGALAVARLNAEALEVESRMRFFVGDLFGPVPPETRYDVITANPPYIAEPQRHELPPDVRDHEPREALFAGGDGLDVLRRLATEARAYLCTGGRLLVEVGAGQADAVCALFEAAGFVDVRAHRDLGAIERVVDGRAPCR
jgi:release factor glutamine methyltransferase